MPTRRDVLKTGAAAGVASLAGCASILEGDGGEDVDPTEESFQYFFEDETGTLGPAAEGNEPPEDAEDWQVITNTLEEEDWQEKQENDVDVARNWLSGDVEDRPSHDGHEGTVEEIVQRTQEIYENPEGALDTSSEAEEYILEQIQQEDDPVAFTRALIHSVDTVTDVQSSGGKAKVVPTIAEYAIKELGLDFSEYELSSMMATEPTDLEDQMIEGSIREREDGSTVGQGGLRHLISLLNYEKEGELQNKYVENIRASPTQLFRSMIRDPEESAYREPIEEGRFNLTENSRHKSWPEHYATAFEQEKLENMIEMGLDIERPGQSFAAAAVNMIDDGLNDRSIIPNAGYNITVSDEIKQQAEDFVLNPTKEKKEKIENFGKITYTVLEKQIAEDYKGEPVYGADDPIRIEGSLENPEFYHEPQQD